MTPAEFNPMGPELEQAVSDIRNDNVDPAVIEAAAARVWSNLSAEAHHLAAGSHIHDCSEFQALIPEYRAGRLPLARATLLKDHLHECVVCRNVYQGKVVAMPAATAQPARRVTPRMRWAVAAAIIGAASLTLWIELNQNGVGTGRAYVQTVNGSLYEVSAAGIRPLLAGQDLADGVEIRTARDSSAMVELRDGSTVELRERSGFSATQASTDLTVHLNRGSIIVQAAKRRKNQGHLYVATADCRVAVTGTIFSVSAGVKGSRVSVIEGEVHVSQDNQEKILHPGDQTVTSTSLEPLSVKDEISWSRNRDRLVQQLNDVTNKLQQIPLPSPRYSSRLLGRLPAGTAVYASIPNLAGYLGEAQSVFNRNLAESPELRAWWSGHGTRVEAIIERLRAASEYLGDEIVITGFAQEGGGIRGPVFLAETKRDGFPEFLKQQAPLAIETRSNLVMFGPDRASVEALAASLDSGGFPATPFYARIADAYRDGAGFLLCADMSKMHSSAGGVRYFIAAQKEIDHRAELRATVGFDGERTGMAAWLAEPAPMGSLDYVSPDATLVTAFVVKNPAVIVDQLLGVHQRTPAGAERALAEARTQTGFDVRDDLAHSLGGEFSLSLDGPIAPVPSWKLVTEVYDPARTQATLQKVIEGYNQQAARSGEKPLRTGQEVVEGRTYYMVAAADPNPLTEAHYTFADGYLIAGPSRALVTRSLQVKTAGTSITHATLFLSMEPRDHYNNYSALIYQNLGKTLAPLAGLLGAFVPQGGGRNPMPDLGNMKPTLIAAYGEPDRITVAGGGDVFRAGMANLMSGNLANVVGSALPFGQMMGARGR